MFFARFVMRRGWHGFVFFQEGRVCGEEIDKQLRESVALIFNEIMLVVLFGVKKVTLVCCLHVERDRTISVKVNALNPSKAVGSGLDSIRHFKG